jgi:DNA-binding NarL/FixJ family response regulator
MIRILLVEDERVIRQSLAELLSRQAGLTVVAAVGRAAEALDAIASGMPVDIVVSDVMIGETPEGLELTSALRSRDPSPPVLLLSSFGEPWMYSSALSAGALGYVLKGSGLEEVVSAIHSVVGGTAVFPGAALHDRLMERPPSTREREIMRLLADGFSNGEIGGRLGIREKTVESHLTRLFARYKLGTRTELALLASRQGWIGKRMVTT